MKITESQYRRIEAYFPRQRGNVSISNLEVLNAILYVAEHGCKWRGLPPRFGNWHTIYTRMNRWAKAGVLDRVKHFEIGDAHIAALTWKVSLYPPILGLCDFHSPNIIQIAL